MTAVLRPPVPRELAIEVDEDSSRNVPGTVVLEPIGSTELPTHIQNDRWISTEQFPGQIWG